MKKIAIFLSCLMLLTSLSACQKSENSVSSSSLSGTATNSSTDSAQTSDKVVSSKTSQAGDSEMIPDFTLEANNGKKVSLSDYKGKIVVLNFWASWCEYCKQELPDFKKLNDQLKHSNDTVLLLLNQTDGQQETKQKANAFLTKSGYNFLDLYDTGAVGRSIFELNGIPATAVIDRQGCLAGYESGMTSYDKVMQMIHEAK